MAPFASGAILEKLALLRIAFCKAPVLSKASWRRTSVMPSALPAAGLGIVLRMATSVNVMRESVWRIVWPKVRAVPHLIPALPGFGDAQRSTGGDHGVSRSRSAAAGGGGAKRKPRRPGAPWRSGAL